MTLAHRLDIIREQCNTLPIDHPMRWLYLKFERALTREWEIMVAEKGKAQ